MSSDDSMKQSGLSAVVASLLQALNLWQHAQLLVGSGLAGNLHTLMCADDSLLQATGLPLGPRKKLLAYAKELSHLGDGEPISLALHLTEGATVTPAPTHATTATELHDVMAGQLQPQPCRQRATHAPMHAHATLPSLPGKQHAAGTTPVAAQQPPVKVIHPLRCSELQLVQSLYPLPPSVQGAKRPRASAADGERAWDLAAAKVLKVPSYDRILAFSSPGTGASTHQPALHTLNAHTNIAGRHVPAMVMQLQVHANSVQPDSHSRSTAGQAPAKCSILHDPREYGEYYAGLTNNGAGHAPVAGTPDGQAHAEVGAHVTARQAVASVKQQRLRLSGLKEELAAAELVVADLRRMVQEAEGRVQEAEAAMHLQAG